MRDRASRASILARAASIAASMAEDDVIEIPVTLDGEWQAQSRAENKALLKNLNKFVAAIAAADAIAKLEAGNVYVGEFGQTIITEAIQFAFTALAQQLTLGDE